MPPSIDSNDPLFRSMLNSQEFKGGSPKQRQTMLLNFRDSNPQERQDAVYGTADYAGLTLANEDQPSHPATMLPGFEFLNALPKETQEQAIAATPDTVKKAAGIGIRTGAGYLAGLTGPAAPFLEGPAQAGAHRLNQFLGLEEGDYKEPFNTQDLLEVGVPTAIRGLGAVTRAVTGPGKRAVTQYDADLNYVKQANAGLVDPDLPPPQNTSTEADALVKPAAKAIKTDQEALAQDKQNLLDYQGALTAHKDAADTLPDLADKYATVDPKPLYTQANTLATKAPKIDTTPFTDMATKMGVQLQLPANGLQPTRYAKITTALEGFGADPVNPGVTVNEATATLQRLTRLTDRLERQGGMEWGAAKKLTAALYVTLENAKRADPVAAAAIDKFMEAQTAQRAKYAAQEFRNSVNSGIKLDANGNPIINKATIYNAIDNLPEKSPLFEGSFRPNEHQDLLTDLNTHLANLPDVQKPGKLPTPTFKPVNPDFLPKPEDNLEVTAHDVRGGVVGGSVIGGLLGHYTTGNYAQGAAIGGPIGAAISLTPALSKAILGLPGGEDFLRQAAAGKFRLTPTTLGAFLGAIKNTNQTDDTTK